MIDSQTHTRLQDIIRHAGRSFLQYSSESFPWATPREQEALAKLQKLVAEERDVAANLARFLIKNRLTPPYLGAYPTVFTNFNYMSLDRLFKELVTHQHKAIAQLQIDLAQIHDLAAREQVKTLLDMKKRHLAALEALNTAPRRLEDSPAGLHGD